MIWSTQFSDVLVYEHHYHHVFVMYSVI